MISPLHGFPKHVTVACINLSSIVELSSDGRLIGGMEGRFLELLAPALGFTYTFVTPPDREWGRATPNGSWTGLVGMLTRGEADLAIGMVAISPDRAEVVDFSLPYSENPVTFVTRFPRPLPRAYACVHPFEWSTWLATGLLLLAMPLLFRAFNRTGVRYGDALFRVYASVLRQPLNVQSNRALNGSWWLTSTILSFSYAAVLSSFLTVPLMEAPVDTFRALAEAVRRGTHRCYTTTGSTMAGQIQRSGEPHLAYIAEQIDKNGWQINMGLPPAEIVNPGNAALGVRFYLHLLFGSGHFATQLVSEDTGAAYPVGIMAAKGFCCMRQLDVAVSRALNGGLFLRLVDRQLFRKGLEHAHRVPTEEGFRGLGVEDVAGAGIVVMVGVALGVWVFAWEVVVGRRGRDGRNRVHPRE